MSYVRVLPRDLFNESSLLKCYARLWILLENANHYTARFETEDVNGFEIEQDESSGAIYVANVVFTVRGERATLSRPLNSREAWPLYLEIASRDPVSVFDDAGNLSKDMKALISAQGFAA